MARRLSPEDPDQRAAAEANYLAAWRLLVQQSNGGSVEETEEILFTVVPAPIPFFNSAFVKPGVDPVRCLESVRAFYTVRGKPFTLRFRESPAATATCQEAGLVPARGTPLMNVATAQVDAPVGIEVRRVDADSWEDHLRIIAAGFGMPPRLIAGMFPPSLLDDDHYAAFNAYIDGDPVSTADLVVIDGVAGIYNVATVEGFRRRGLGEATTRAAVAEGCRRSCGTATLQSSELGYSVYERMGFRTVAIWMSLTGGEP